MKENIKFIPKTFQVSENKQPVLSPSARAKVINRSGSSYVSERITAINPSYGPMPNNSSNSFSITITVSGDRYYIPMFETCGAKFSTCTLDSVDKAREWARKLGNGEVKIVDTGHNNERQTDTEKEIKKGIEEIISEFEKADLKEGEARGYKIINSKMA